MMIYMELKQRFLTVSNIDNINPGAKKKHLFYFLRVIAERISKKIRLF